jgi:hypothetical protein
MAASWLGKTTLSVTELGWTGAGFSDTLAREMWEQMPDPLRNMAVAELAAGNIAHNILRNIDRGIVLLAFAKPPLTKLPEEASVRVHHTFQNGNYCYDGTACTYEHLPSGCFLAFDDPDYKDAP